MMMRCSGLCIPLAATTFAILCCFPTLCEAEDVTVEKCFTQPDPHRGIPDGTGPECGEDCGGARLVSVGMNYGYDPYPECAVIKTVLIKYWIEHDCRKDLQVTVLTTEDNEYHKVFDGCPGPCEPFQSPQTTNMTTHWAGDRVRQSYALFVQDCYNYDLGEFDKMCVTVTYEHCCDDEDDCDDDDPCTEDHCISNECEYFEKAIPPCCRRDADCDDGDVCTDDDCDDNVCDNDPISNCC